MSDNEYIDIVELSKKLIAKKKVIFLGSLVLALIVIVLKVGVLGFKNTATQTFMIKIPETVNTEYGGYKIFNTRTIDNLTLLNNNRVISKTIEDLNLPISVNEFSKGMSYVLTNKNNPDESTNVIISFSSTTDENLANILPVHIDNFVHELNRILTLKINLFYTYKTKVRLKEVERLLLSEKLHSASVDSLMDVLSNEPIFNSFDGSLKNILEVKTESKVKLVTLKSEKLQVERLLNQLVNDMKSINSDDEAKEIIDFYSNYVQVLNAPTVDIVSVPKELVKLSIFGFLLGLVLNSVFWLVIIFYKSTRKSL